MLDEPAKKTESALKVSRRKGRLIFVAILATLIIVAGVIGLLYLNKDSSNCTNFNCMIVERVSSQQDLAQGLSDRQSMPENQAMLFAFPQVGDHCLWMKDMRFAIDMIWLDEAKEVVTVEENVSPDTYPKSFCPDKPVRYAIEVNAGVAKTINISPGSVLNF